MYEVSYYTLHGCIQVKNQKYILEDGRSTDYLSLCNRQNFHNYSTGLCNFIESWLEDLSYERVSELLSQVIGNEVFSSLGVQSYLGCKAAPISEAWVARSNVLVETIAVLPDVLTEEVAQVEYLRLVSFTVKLASFCKMKSL